MPRYDFRCDDCTTVFELKRRMSQADAPAACPECGGEKTYKLLARIAVHAGSSASTLPPSQPMSNGGGACCGGGCACGAHS